MKLHDVGIGVTDSRTNVLSKALSLANSAKEARCSGDVTLSTQLSSEALELVGLGDETSFAETIETHVFNSSDCFLELQTLLDIQIAALSIDHPSIRETLERLIQRWDSWLSDYYVLLAPIYDRLIALRISQIGAEHSEIADRLMSYGDYLVNRGASSDALNCFTRAVAIRKASLGKSPSLNLSYAQSLTRLGCLSITLNQYELAEVHLKTAVDLLAPSRSKLKLHALEDLGTVYIELGKYEEAEKLLTQALTITDIDALSSIGNCAISLGSIYLFWGRLEDAFALFDFSINLDGNSSWSLPEINEIQQITDEISDKWNPFLEIFESMEKRYSSSDVRRFCRNLMVRKYSWAIPTEDALAAIARCGAVIEIGAGTGYWSALLKQRGADAIAYDYFPSEGGQNSYTLKRKSWSEVIAGTESVVSYHPNRALMLCWPPDKDEMAYRALKCYTGDRLIYVGEQAPGCTADEKFHKLVEDEWNLIEKIDLPRWHLIKDSLFVYSRR